MHKPRRPVSLEVQPAEAVSGEPFDALADRCYDRPLKDQANASGSGTDGFTGYDREDRGHD